MLSSHQSPAKHVTYWYREHKSKHDLPVLFIHGIGVGLFPYATFIGDINKGRLNDDVGIIAIELLAISSRITSQAFDRDVLVNEIRHILDSHSWTRCVLVGHSYGTAICTHLLKSSQTSAYIGPVILVDPICFMLHLPDVAYNFTVRKPTTAQEYVLWYFASKDIGVAHTLGRRFFWSLNILWKEDLEDDSEVGYRDVTVVLSERDDIVDVNAVRRYLSSQQVVSVGELSDSITDALLQGDQVPQLWTGRGLEIMWMDKLHHAQVFDYEAPRRQLVDVAKTYCEKARDTEEIP